jgi:capsid protein
MKRPAANTAPRSRRASGPDTASRPAVDNLRAQYDAVAPGAKTKRRNARVESTDETGILSTQLPPMQRLMMLNLCRDAARNFSVCRSMLRQLALNVVGTEYKLRLKLDHDAKNPKDPVTAAMRWFNSRWAKACDFRSDRHLADINRLLVQSVAREGDVGMLFDHDFQGTGRLIAYESDQICDPSPLPPGVASSDDGVLLDAFGREIGYFCTQACGQTSAPLASGIAFPRDPLDEDKNMFRLLRAPWRFRQGRGTSELFGTIADLLDIYEMRSKEIQTAKAAASIGGVIKKRQPDGPELTDSRLDPANTDPEGTAKPVAEQTTYKKLESLTGGYFEYLEGDDEFELIDPKRPNPNFAGFAEHVVCSAGSAWGMARCYATMQANASYTAFRGEMIMTWVTFAWWQKWLERQVQDWQAIRALRFAMAGGMVPALPPDWELAMAWQHPRMPSVNPLIDQQTFLAALKNGATSMERELGPAWRETVDELVAELEILREGKVPHAIFETKSGGAAPDGGTPAAAE